MTRSTGSSTWRSPYCRCLPVYPRVIEHAKQLTDCGSPELHFQLGVDMFIAGVEAAAKQAGYKE